MAQGSAWGGQAPGASAVGAEIVASWRGFLHGHGPGWSGLGPGDAEPTVRVFGSSGETSPESAVASSNEKHTCVRFIGLDT